MQITTFKWVPVFAQGYVRDLIPRWALEEIGAEYTVKLIGFPDARTEEYLQLQPFSQVPVFNDAGLTMFESGAILLHIGEKSELLLPSNPHARIRAKTWLFAAQNSVEPSVHPFIEAHGEASSNPVQADRLPKLQEALNRRLTALDRWLEGRTYLEDHFTVGDLMMTYVLRHLVESRALEPYKNLLPYLERCMARPAFKKALADQMQVFVENEPA